MRQRSAGRCTHLDACAEGVAPLVTLPAVALLLVAPPLAEDREEAEARHALDRLRSEGGYANMPTAADQCEWSAAAGMVESLRRKDARLGSAH